MTFEKILDQAVAMLQRRGRVTYGTLSATRPCGSKGIGGCDATMKLCVSSSRCKSCPAKGEPARAGSKPCAVLGNKFCEA
jgi:hypothetical protein